MALKSDVLNKVADKIINNEFIKAKDTICKEYPFQKQEIYQRSYTLKEKINIFVRDGFIDRYSGERLVNPGFLKVLSVLYPEDFPYNLHWKMTETHNAFWELSPTIDHIIPVSIGGTNCKENWVTTSMLNNSIKSNWTLEQLKWRIYPPGEINEWDGLTKKFIRIVETNEKLLNDGYIKKWYYVSI